MRTLADVLAEHDEVEARRAEVIAEGFITSTMYQYDEKIADLDERAYDILCALVEAIRDGSVLLYVPMIPEKDAGLVRVSGHAYLTPTEARELSLNLSDAAFAADNCNL